MFALLGAATGCDSIHDGDYCSYEDLNRTICDWGDAFTCIDDGYDYIWRENRCYGDETCIETTSYTAACFAYCNNVGDINPEAYVCNGDLLMISECDYVFDRYNSASSSPVWTSKTVDYVWLDSSSVLECRNGRLVTSYVGNRIYDTGYCTSDKMIRTSVLTVTPSGKALWVDEYLPSFCNSNREFIQCDNARNVPTVYSCNGYVCRDYTDSMTGYMSAHCD